MAVYPYYKADRDFKANRKEFIADLADLMDRHRVELRVEDHGVFLQLIEPDPHKDFYFQADQPSTRAADFRKAIFKNAKEELHFKVFGK